MSARWWVTYLAPTLPRAVPAGETGLMLVTDNYFPNDIPTLFNLDGTQVT